MTEGKENGGAAQVPPPFDKAAETPAALEVAGHIAEAKAAKLKHTAGPWQAQHEFDMNGACTIVGNIQDHDGDYGQPHLTYTTICDINEEPDEWLANRALIIAAPEIKDALAGLVGLTTLLLARDDLPAQVREALQSNHRVVTARAALAKAEE